MSRRLTAVLVAVASLLALGDSAEAAWSPTPANLSAAGANAVDAVTAVGPGGHVALAWRRLDAQGDWRVQVRVRAEDGTLSPVQSVSPEGDSAFAPDVAVDATGRVVVVWSQRDDKDGSFTVLAKVRSADGALSAARRLSSGVGSGTALRSPDPQVELVPGGAAVVAWQALFRSTAYRAVTRTVTQAGTVDEDWQALSRLGVVDRPVALGVDAQGTATVAWARDDGADSRVEARTRAADGTLGALEVVTAAGRDSTTPAVAVTPAGDAVLAWVHTDGAETGLFSRRLSAAGVLSATRRVSPVGEDVADDPTTGWGEVAVGDAGDAVLVWQQEQPGDTKEVAVRGLTAANTLSPLVLAGTTSHAHQPQVVVGPGGEGQVAFTQRDDGFWDRVVVRSRAADGTLGDVQILSASGRDAHRADLAMNDAGLAAAIWVRADSPDPACCDRAQYAVGP